MKDSLEGLLEARLALPGLLLLGGEPETFPLSSDGEPWSWEQRVWGAEGVEGVAGGATSTTKAF